MAFVWQLLNLYVHRQGHNTTGRRLRQIDLVCSQGGPQGPGRCVRCLGSSAGGTERRSSIKGGVIGLFFPATFYPPCASPRAQTAGRRLHKTVLVRVQSGPQGPGRCARCPGPSAVGTRRRSTTKGGVICTFGATFGPLRASPRAQHDGAAAASNRPGTCAGWSIGPRQVC